MPWAAVEAYRRHRGWIDPSFLDVGAIHRRKDFAGLVQAYAMVRSAKKPMRLAKARQLSPGRSDPRRIIEISRLKPEIDCPGFEQDPDLPAQAANYQ